MVHPIRATRLPPHDPRYASPTYNFGTREGLLRSQPTPYLMHNLLQPPPDQSAVQRMPRHIMPATADPMATASGSRPPAAGPPPYIGGEEYFGPAPPPPPVAAAPGPAGPAIATPADEAEAGTRLASFARNLGAIGPSLIAAGALTTDPSARGKYIAQGAQAYRKSVEASKATELARQERGAISRMAVKLGMPPDTPPNMVMEGMKTQTAAGKFGTPTVIADPDSTTGYSRVQVAQDGKIRYLGAAMPPPKMYDTELYQKKSEIEHSKTIYKDATKAIDEADRITARVNQFMSLVNRVESGTLAETKLAVRKFLSAVGIQQDMTKIATAETMKSQGMGFVLDLIQKTKGAISEKEMEAFKKASAGIENTPAGNTMILNLSQMIANRMKAEAQAVRSAYKTGVTAKELDDIRFAAREKFGSVVPARIVVHRYKVGDIKDDPENGKRYKFLGGDSTKQENWMEL